MTNSITFADVLRGGMELIRENDIICFILIGVGCVVILFLAYAILVDFSRAVKEQIFLHWLKKDGNFTKFSTEREARKGYRRYLEELRYERMTRGWRRKLEGKKVSFSERYANLCEWFGGLPDMNDIRAFFRKKFSGESKAE